MILRVILFWFMGVISALANLPRYDSVITVPNGASVLNQYDSLNGSNAQVYGDLTFAATGNTLVNGTNAFTNIAANIYGLAVTNILTVNLPSTVSFQYDANGNLTSDGTRSFYYDAENRLTNVTVASQWQTVFVYDGLNRRRITQDYAWQTGAWVETNETRYIFDGMFVLQERNSNNTPVATYTRGLDLSTSLSGAGGIGGMLARRDTNGSTYYHADGGGNITSLMDTNGNIVARAMYDPYGKMLALSGSMAATNRYWFSSKEQHPNGLYSFGFRFYEPNFSRWLNRDVVGEAGGINLYGFNNNNPAFYVDADGLAPGDWWDARTYFNSGFTEGWSDAANSIGQSMGGSLAIAYDSTVGDRNIAQGELNYVAGITDVSQDAYDALRGVDPTGLLPANPNDPNADLGQLLGSLPGTLDGAAERTVLMNIAKKCSQRAKRRLAKALGGVPRSTQPSRQGRYGKGTKWWEYPDSQGNKKIVVEHPDNTVHIGTPKPQSQHPNGPPQYYPVPGTGHVGE